MTKIHVKNVVFPFVLIDMTWIYLSLVSDVIGPALSYYYIVCGNSVALKLREVK